MSLIGERGYIICSGANDLCRSVVQAVPVPVVLLRAGVFPVVLFPVVLFENLIQSRCPYLYLCLYLSQFRVVRYPVVLLRAGAFPG